MFKARELGWVLPGREQVLCCKDGIKSQAVQANRLFWVFCESAQLPGSPERAFGGSLSAGRCQISDGKCGGVLAGAGWEAAWRADAALGGGGPSSKLQTNSVGEKENPRVGVFFKCNACCVVILSELILVVIKSEKNLDCCSSCSASSRGSYRSYSAFCTTCWLLCVFSEFLCMWLGGTDRHLQNCNCWSQIWSSFFLYIPSKELGFSSFWCIGTKYLNCKHCHANACVEKVCTSSSFWSFPFLTATTTTKKSSRISRWQFKFKSCLLCSHGNYYKGICRVHDK